MALPTPTPIGFVQIPNRDFEAGATGWTTSGSANIVNEPQLGGSWCVKAEGSDPNDGQVILTDGFPVVPGQVINVTLRCQFTAGSPGTSASADLSWYDSAGSFLSSTEGAEVSRSIVGSSVSTASVGGMAPPGAAMVRPRSDLNVAVSSTIFVDDFSWNYTFPVACVLTQPGAEYSEVETIPYRINIGGLTSGVTVESVKYYMMTWDGAEYVDATLLSTQTVAPYNFNAPALPEGQYAGYAIVRLSNGLDITTNSREFLVGEVPAPDTREFKASNSYTYLLGENFSSLASALPPTAIVTGAEVVVQYDMDVLVRASDLGVDDPTLADPSVAFSVVTGGNVEAVLLNKSGSSYSVSGGAATTSIPIEIVDFTLAEQGTSDDKKWAVYSLTDEATVTVGSPTTLFGQASIDAASFLSKAIGLRFFPTLGTKPATAGSGDACYRFKINTFKLRVYFDAGSVEYYFASPAKDDVIKGELAASNVTSGAFSNGDAEGVMQLLPDLEIIDGTADTILDGWTIHGAYPPTDSNQIGVVAMDMYYNGLPSYEQVESNRSRYVFITANFYGDASLDSIYGANGVGRAFAYNGDFFYKIQTTPDDEKDNPRHVAFHHTHLALGFGEGRVDISVVGEPYNFDGAQGASSWAIGDRVVGLLPLSGAILGIFCKKSIVGLSGTTVDNFATQTLSPNIGAVEYTITDMGFPVYANAYGIYTLSQTAQYGDYLGNPLSQQVSPWLRPRLIRKAESNKEVVVAWPVRSKNQYKLAFSDGYVLTMTMNYGTQQAPTFSKQKYFTWDNETIYTSLYEYPSIVPAAISSELDDNGEERIHVANKVAAVTPTPPENTFYMVFGEGRLLLRYGTTFSSGVTSIHVTNPNTGDEGDWSADTEWGPLVYTAFPSVQEEEGSALVLTDGSTTIEGTLKSSFQVYLDVLDDPLTYSANFFAAPPWLNANQPITITVFGPNDITGTAVWDDDAGTYILTTEEVLSQLTLSNGIVSDGTNSTVGIVDVGVF